MLNTPVDRIRCSLVGELRVPARVSSLSVLPSPLSGRVGVHITTFEACSSFTRVTACTVAHLPYVSLIARLRPGQFPGSGARKLPSSTNNLLGWVLPPLVICAVEAHTVTPCFVHNELLWPEANHFSPTATPSQVDLQERQVQRGRRKTVPNPGPEFREGVGQ
jgi:hypothetical protein